MRYTAQNKDHGAIHYEENFYDRFSPLSTKKIVIESKTPKYSKKGNLNRNGGFFLSHNGKMKLIDVRKVQSLDL